MGRVTSKKPKGPSLPEQVLTRHYKNLTPYLFALESDENPLNQDVRKLLELKKEMLLKSLDGLSIDEIIKRFAATLLMHDVVKYLYKMSDEERKVFAKYFKENELLRLANDNKRQTPKGTKRAEDRRRQLECLNAVTNNNPKGAVPYDFRRFEILLRAKYPKPLYVSEPRLTPEEKAQTPELVKETKERKMTEKLDKGWPLPSLYKFFKDETGIDGSTRK